MNEDLAPAGQAGQEPNLDRRTSKFSKKTQQTKDINRSKILIGIANKWVSMGIYPSTNSALIALLEGLL
jgi:hypothetical protein